MATSSDSAAQEHLDQHGQGVIHSPGIVDDDQVPTTLGGCRRFPFLPSLAGGRILAWKRKFPKGCCCIQKPLPLGTVKS
jgi:hypothetical protein